MPIVLRRAWAVLSIAILMAGLTFPPVHMHLGEGAEGHDHAAVVHAHWAAHTTGSSSTRWVTDADGRLLFVDQPATGSDDDDEVLRALPVVVLAHVVAGCCVGRPQSPSTGAGTPRDGPSNRRSSPRAPPLAV